MRAPGSTLDSSYPANRVSPLLYGGSSTDYFTLSGTSMAAPQVAGAVAVLLRGNGTLNPNTVKAVIRAIMRATVYINTNPIEKSAAALSPALEVPAEDLATIMKENIYSNEWDQRAVEGSNEFIKWGADLKYVSKPMDVKEVTDFRYLKELAGDKIKVPGY